jgi:2'-5' RNA ligase
MLIRSEFARNNARPRALEHGQAPLGAALVETQEINVAGAGLDLEVAIAGAEPAIDDFGDVNGAGVELQPAGHLGALIATCFHVDQHCVTFDRVRQIQWDKSDMCVDLDQSPGPPPPARVFVALRTAPEIAAELTQMTRVLERFSVRLIAADDIHLTLVPPWNETTIAAAVDKLRGVAEKAAPFTLNFRQLSYGPQRRRPRLVWAECAESEALSALHAALLAAFGQTEERLFRPHVTVARIRGNGAAVARKQPIDRALQFSQQVDSVELMQSPPAGETGYRVLASLKLGGNRQESIKAD